MTVEGVDWEIFFLLLHIYRKGKQGAVRERRVGVRGLGKNLHKFYFFKPWFLFKHLVKKIMQSGILIIP